MNTAVLAAPVARKARPVALGVLGLMLVAAMLWGLSSGAMDLPVARVMQAIVHAFADGALDSDDHVVLMLRMPRVLMAVLVGAALACGGTTMQGLFRNPLADPGLIGVSAGAALGAVSMIVLGHRLAGSMPDDAGAYRVTVAAFVGGLVATALVYVIGRRRTGVATLLLAGVAINAISMAGVGMLTFLASENQLRDLTFWTLGSLGGSDWTRLLIVAPLMVLPVLLLPRMARALNALLLGENEAALMGFRPERLQPLLVVLVALMVSAAVAMTGVISFVGLVVPHVLRLAWGPDHRLLLPASALGGGVLLVVADTLARTVVVPAELPIGVLTALVGGPFFLWLLMRSRMGAGV